MDRFYSSSKFVKLPSCVGIVPVCWFPEKLLK